MKKTGMILVLSLLMSLPAAGLSWADPTPTVVAGWPAFFDETALASDRAVAITNSRGSGL